MSDWYTPTEAEALFMPPLSDRALRRHAAKQADNPDLVKVIRRNGKDSYLLSRVYLEQIATESNKVLRSIPSGHDRIQPDDKPEKAIESDRFEGANNDHTRPDTTGTHRTEPDAALLQHLRGEVDYLRGQLDQANKNTEAALTRLAESEDRAKVLLAAVATGKIATITASSASEEADTTQTSVVTPPNASENKSENEPRQETGRNQSGDYSLKNNSPRPWWKFWKGE